MGWGFRGGSKQTTKIITPVEKQVLGIDRAMAEYSLTLEEVQAIPIHRYNSYMGNSYAVWCREDLINARTQKRLVLAAERKVVQEAEEIRLEAQYGSKEALAEHRRIEREAADKAYEEAAAKRDKECAKTELESLRAKISVLQPGAVTPAPLPTAGVNKKLSKEMFFLTDKDLAPLNTVASGSSKLYSAGDVLQAAIQKHGQVGLDRKRQNVEDAASAVTRSPLEQRFQELEERYPDLKVSPVDLQLREIAKLEDALTAASSAVLRAQLHYATVKDKLTSAKETYTSLVDMAMVGNGKESETAVDVYAVGEKRPASAVL
jgi:hypothetical protein